MIYTTSESLKNNVGASYDNISSAQMSMEYAMAAIIVDNELGVDQYTEAKIASEQLRDMVKRVKVVVDPELDCRDLNHRMAAQVKIYLSNGTKLRSSYVRRTVKITTEQVQQKFMKLASKALKDEPVRNILEAVRSLEKYDGIRFFIDLPMSRSLEEQ